MAGSAWNSGDPKTTIGDARWSNYTVSANVLFEAAGTQYATIGAREQGGTANGSGVSVAELRVDPTGAWTLQRFGTTIASGTVAGDPKVGFKTGAGVWNSIAVTVAGAVYTASINGVQVSSYTDSSPQATGRIQLGSSFNFVQFDDLTVTTVPGYTPYETAEIDGMHQTSWSDNSVPVLQFDSGWSHVNGEGMFEWQRTSSKSTRKGAAMTYTFTGTGLDVIGTNSGTPTLDVIVDGVQILTSAPTLAAGSERTAFTLRGLKNGPHTVVLKTANDNSDQCRRRGHRHGQCRLGEGRHARPVRRGRQGERTRQESSTAPTPGPEWTQCSRMHARLSPTRCPSASTPRARHPSQLG